MRAFFLALMLAACSGNGLPPGGNTNGGGSLPDLATARPPPDLSGSRIDLAGPPPGETCVSNCNRCNGGGCCGTACCAAGEWCDATFTCRCGSGSACTGTLICATGGPIMPGGNTCGGICCGDASHPCPL